MAAEELACERERLAGCAHTCGLALARKLQRFCCILCALVSACASGRAVRGDVLTSGATDSQAEHKSTRRYLTNRNGSSQIVGVLISPFSVYI